MLQWDSNPYPFHQSNCLIELFQMVTCIWYINGVDRSSLSSTASELCKYRIQWCYWLNVVWSPNSSWHRIFTVRVVELIYATVKKWKLFNTSDCLFDKKSIFWPLCVYFAYTTKEIYKTLYKYSIYRTYILN